LRDKIVAFMRDGEPWLRAIELACKHSLFPLEAAIAIFESAGSVETSADLRTIIDEGRTRKPPQSEIA